MRKFEELVNIVNNNPTERITRESLLKQSSHGVASMDTYRRMLTLAGYLKHTGRGEYKRVKLIPTTLTKTECFKQAYPHNAQEEGN